MEHVSIDSGTAGIFDDVNKSDFKADFSSEFPVGLPLILCMPVMLLVPVAAVAIATECPSMPSAASSLWHPVPAVSVSVYCLITLHPCCVTVLPLCAALLVPLHTHTPVSAPRPAPCPNVLSILCYSKARINVQSSPLV